MRTKNYSLLQAIYENRMTQGEIVRAANLASETRMSKIVNQTVQPTDVEIQKICRVLKRKSIELGFSQTGSPRNDPERVQDDPNKLINK